MDEPIEEVAKDGLPVPAPKTNRGWFKPGDRRINLEGRPRGSKPAETDVGLPLDCARQADRVMLLFVNGAYLTHRLLSQYGPWLTGVPGDFQIVGCRFDAGRNGIVFTIRSETFARVAKGATIPEIQPGFNGLKWRGSEWPDRSIVYPYAVG